jgi:hypothetical protein
MKPSAIDDQHHVFAEPAGIDGVAGIQLFEPRTRRALRHSFRRPVLALERIDAGDDIAIRAQKAICRFRRIADIGIDPEQVRELRIGQKIRDAIVTRPLHQAVAVAEKNRVSCWRRSRLPEIESHSACN